MIEVKDLVKQYGNHLAVNHLSFTVEKGQIYGFLGPNGAGKSTTMNIMTGYLGATSGEVLIQGVNILEEPEKAKKSIGYLPEIPPLYTDMTVYEYLMFVAELKKIPKKEREHSVEKVIAMIKLEEVSHRLIKNLSKGYKQRVGLAQAIIGFPEIIILDEPMVGLDPKQIIEMRDLIKQLAKEHTIILSSHILSEVSAICDHIMIISHGELVASDTPDNLERLMSGQSVLQVTIKGNENKVISTLEGIEGIDNIITLPEIEHGFVELQITAKDDKDIRENIFYQCANNQLPIYNMQYNKVTLEDVFLELTQCEKEKKELDVVEELEHTREEENEGRIETKDRNKENKEDRIQEHNNENREEDINESNI